MDLKIKKQSKSHPILLLFIVFLLVPNWQCTRRLTDWTQNKPAHENDLVQPVGERRYLEMATWNTENFPKEGTRTVQTLTQMVRDLDIDLIAFQEIASVSYFESMLDSLEGWTGVYSQDVYSNGSYQKTAVIYKNEFIALSGVRNIFENDRFAFPRPPLLAYVQIKDLQGVRLDFNLIVLHLKAQESGNEDDERRKSACKQLAEFIHEEIAAGADSDFVVMGDWNDQIDDPLESNVFYDLLTDSDSLFVFLTRPITYQQSYISTSLGSLIDHIMITRTMLSWYDNGPIRVLYLDDQYPLYVNEVSDHRPVMVRFAGIELDLPPLQ